MPEAVIVDAVRTPIGRAFKGSLAQLRPDEMDAVVAGQGDAYIAAGVEWVSRYNEAVEGARPQDQNENLQGRDGQPDAYISMGMTAENVADRYEVSRADMDKYAQRSQELAVESQENGFFDREIVPVTTPDGTEVAKDDGPRASSTLEKLSQLQPAFREDGKVTAGNSCPLNDGAAAALIMTTLLNGLETDDKTIGLETMCVAGGQGEAMIVERLS